MLCLNFTACNRASFLRTVFLSFKLKNNHKINYSITYHDTNQKTNIKMETEF